MVAEPLTADAFAPFGTVVTRPSAAPDATGPGWAWWVQTGALPPADYAIGYLALEPVAPAFDWAEYHPDSVELVAPLALDAPLTAMVALARRADTVVTHFPKITITMED
jgi:hypothetical protein